MTMTQSPTILVASRNHKWRASCVRRLISNGCDVHTALDGFRAIDNLRKHRYEMIILDESLNDVSVIELHLTIQDITHNAPAELIALDHDDDVVRFRKRLNGERANCLIGTPDEIRERIVPVLEASQATTDSATSSSSR